METDVARWLVSGEAEPAIELAASFADPDSLGAGDALRRVVAPERAAAVLDLVALRRRGIGKLGEVAERLFLTREGLEQATRWDVASWRARCITRAGVSRAGVSRVVDAGCGLGIDALACRSAGLEVTAIEVDPVTAVLATANLGCPGVLPETAPGFRVIASAVEDVDLTDWLADPGTAIFLDPARRTGRGRSWHVGDLSPSWEFVTRVLDRARGPVVVKLGPGFPRQLLPEYADVTWVSHGGDLVETTLWSGPVTEGRREAVVLEPGGGTNRTVPIVPPEIAEHRLRADRGVSWREPTGTDPTITAPSAMVPTGTDPTSTDPTRTNPTWTDPTETDPSATDPTNTIPTAKNPTKTTLTATSPLGAYIYEPDPAVIRARAVGRLAGLLQARPVAGEVAYLSGDQLIPTPFATAFAVLDTIAYSEKMLRTWARDNGIGVMEIKVRGLDVDPAALRRRLRLGGKNSTCVILTPTPAGATAVIVRRIAG